MQTMLSGSSELFLTNLNRIENALSQANQQISSGYRITAASDAPDEVAMLLQLRADQQHNTQVESNLSLAAADASSADGALSTATQLMDRALTLAAQGANATQTADTRASIAQEVEALQAEMVAASQTTVQGHYIFGGDQNSSPSYVLDLNSANGVDLLSSSQATARVEDASGGSFAATQTAQQIFDDRNSDGSYASDNVFSSLNNLRLALLANDSDAITEATSALKQASVHLNSAQAFYGAVENRIQDATAVAQSQNVNLATEISNKQDADIPTAAMELTQASTQLQAAFTMEAKMPTTTLFDYLG
jgi:flagellar hook-associated protein 3 FlgL